MGFTREEKLEVPGVGEIPKQTKREALSLSFVIRLGFALDALRRFHKAERLKEPLGENAKRE